MLTTFSTPKPLVRHLDVAPYRDTLAAMKIFNNNRNTMTADELWSVEHPPIYSVGMNSRLAHLHDIESIPVVHADRGGQITYHGPGQLVLYSLLDLRRLGVGPRTLISAMEQAVIAVLSEYGLAALTRPGAPGVYIETHKIASIGLRIQKGYTSHGVALNVDNDLTPFERIDPCGVPGLSITSFRQLGLSVQVSDLRARLADEVILRLPYCLSHVTLTNQGVLA